MERIGVAAVVEGLSSFLGDMSKMDDSIRSLVSPTNILGSAFGALGNILGDVGGFIVNTLAHAFGELLADAIQFVITQIRELITATIEAGKEFQTLSLRLNTLNFNDLTESEQGFSNAQELATDKTREQLSWLQRLAATTPYDNTDISNVYTLARGYGFMDEEARGLTNTVIDFTSGMGLSSVEMVRIIKNFGQMQSLGKVMQRDLNDLATGAFVPVNKVLEMMRLETGLAGDEFDDFRTSAEGVDSFLRNFTKLVEDDFGGAAQKMARTFGAATDNVKDFVKSVFGLNVVKPILDVLGGRIADFMDELTSEDRWNTIVGIADRIGVSASGIVEDIIGLAPGVEGMADAVVVALEGIADWLDENKDDIVNFVKDIVKGFKDELLPAIQQVWAFLFGSEGEPGAIQKFGAWLKDEFLPFIQREVIPAVEDLIDAITGKVAEPKTGELPDQVKREEEEPKTTALQNVVASVVAISTALPAVLALLGAIGTAIMVAFGGDQTQTFAEFITNTLIPAIQELTVWINENQEAVGLLFKALLLLEIIGFIIGLVVSFIVFLVGMAVAIVAVVAGVLALIAAFLNFAIVGVVIGLIVLQFKIMQFAFTAAVGALKIMIDTIIADFVRFKDNIIRTFTEMKAAIVSQDWAGAGKALIAGFMRGISAMVPALMALVTKIAKNALAALEKVFKIKSPSAEMFDIGEMIMKGLAKGVTDSAGMAVKAMSKTASAVLAAANPKVAYTMATTAPSQNTYQTNNNFNASFNSNTKNESLMQDFSMLQSLVGA